MKVLITGATGGLGQNASSFLRSHGYEVLLTGRNTTILSQLKEQGFKTIATDLIKDDLKPLFDHVEAVVHCAALSSPWGTENDFLQANVLATQRLLDHAIKADCRRFVHVSSPSVCFEYKDRFGIREDEPLPRPVNAYAKTKAMAEQIVLQSSKNLEVLGIRPRAIYGPHDTTLLPRLLRIAQKGSVPLFRGGLQQVDLCSTRNACEALRLCLEASPKALGHFYNITNGSPLPLRKALEDIFYILGVDFRFKALPTIPIQIIAALLETWAKMTSGNEPLMTRYGVGVLTYGQTLDISKAQNLLGYVPPQSWTESLVEFAAWRRSHDY